ncbi:MAG: hypothetical protein AB1444_08025 [Spirochaetota bacterium]
MNTIVHIITYVVSEQKKKTSKNKGRGIIISNYRPIGVRANIKWV